MTENRYFAGPRRPTTGEHHIYDREKPAENKRDKWRTSLCGATWATTTSATSIYHNLDRITCKSCLRIYENRDA